MLNANSLRDRVSADITLGSTRKKYKPVFMELASGAMPSIPEYMVEVEGPVVRVRLRGVGVAEVVTLARSLREEESR